MTEIFFVSFHVNQLFPMDGDILQVFWSSQKLKYSRKKPNENVKVKHRGN